MKNQNTYLIAKDQFNNCFVGSLADLEAREKSIPDENWEILEANLTREEAWDKWEEYNR